MVIQIDTEKKTIRCMDPARFIDIVNELDKLIPEWKTWQEWMLFATPGTSGYDGSQTVNVVYNPRINPNEWIITCQYS